MSKKIHYLYLNYNDSSDIYPSNSPWDFQVNLNDSINLNGEWLCALTDITCDKKIKEPLLIFCDFCEVHFVCNKLLPIIRKTYIPEFFSRFYNCKITRDQLTTFRIYIRTLDLKIPTFTCKKLSCTLRLKSA